MCGRFVGFRRLEELIKNFPIDVANVNVTPKSVQSLDKPKMREVPSVMHADFAPPVTNAKTTVLLCDETEFPPVSKNTHHKVKQTQKPVQALNARSGLHEISGHHRYT